MSYQQALGVAAVLVSAIGYSVYFKGIIAGKIKPHAFSWLIWTLLGSIGFAAQVVGGGGPGAWVTGFSAAVSVIIVGIGFGKSSRILITRSDWFFFLGTLVAIPPWYFTGNPFWSVIIITIIDTVAYVPTFRKAYFHPYTESLFHSSLAGLKFVLAIVALTSFSVTTVLYPASLVLTNGLFVAMLIWRRNSLRVKES